MARIVIVRSNEYMNRFRGFGLYLNGEKLGDIFNDEKEEFEIPEGEHQLVAKIDWCSSPVINFKVKGNETETFNISGFKHNKIIIPISFCLALLHLLMRYVFHEQLSIIFILPIISLLVFYISIGRKQYLSLEQTDLDNGLSAERVK